MRLTRSFQKEDWDSSKKIIIYGAGRYGEIALRGLEKVGLWADFFADRDYPGKEYFGVPVIQPAGLTKYRSEIFLIASLNYFYEMYRQLQQIGADNIYDIEALMDGLDESQLSEYALDEKKNIQKYQDMIRFGNQSGLVIRHIELVVTERCSLKCRHCASLMPYYTYPTDFAWARVTGEFDRFLSTIDLLLELRILGGEPFLYKDLHKMINKYTQCEKIKRVTIYTNATVVPGDQAVQALKNSKVSVHISDYGLLSKKLKELQQIFTNQNISHTIHHYEKWYDMGPVSKRDDDDSALKKRYDRCYAANCHTFLDGRLYICPRAAHGENLGFFHNGPGETVDFKEGRTDIQEKREQLLQMLDGKRIFEACRYCGGGGGRSPEVRAAEQMGSDL